MESLGISGDRTNRGYLVCSFSVAEVPLRGAGYLEGNHLWQYQNAPGDCPRYVRDASSQGVVF